MTDEDLLEDATAHFENTFDHVQMGNQAVCFYVDGVRHEYVEVCSGGVKEEGASLECFDTAASKGYITGNIAIICWRCNAIKRDATLAELEQIVAYMKAN